MHFRMKVRPMLTHKRMQADVTTTATRYIGTIHDFIMLNPITDTPAARGAIAQACHTHKE